MERRCDKWPSRGGRPAKWSAAAGHTAYAQCESTRKDQKDQRTTAHCNNCNIWQQILLPHSARHKISTSFITTSVCVAACPASKLANETVAPSKKKEKPAKKPALGTITLIANQPEIDQNYQ